jgi:hypothetical protein
MTQQLTLFEMTDELINRSLRCRANVRGQILRTANVRWAERMVDGLVSQSRQSTDPLRLIPHPIVRVADHRGVIAGRPLEEVVTHLAVAGPGFVALE